MSFQKPELKISIISDYICPFCFIAHKRLCALKKDYELKINWCFVEIHPDIPPEGQPFEQLGYSEEHWQQLMNSFVQLAAEEGIQPANRSFISNSRKALLLAEACKKSGTDLFNAIHDRIFESYFIQGQDIGDEKTLKQLAQECHVPDRLLEFAWNDPYTQGPSDSVPKTLLAYLQYAGAIQAQSVPTLVIGQRMITGVVDKKTLLTAAADSFR